MRPLLRAAPVWSQRLTVQPRLAGLCPAQARVGPHRKASAAADTGSSTGVWYTRPVWYWGFRRGCCHFICRCDTVVPDAEPGKVTWRPGGQTVGACVCMCVHARECAGLHPDVHACLCVHVRWQQLLHVIGLRPLAEPRACRRICWSRAQFQP